MREILFRGKTNKDKWIYGSFLVYRNIGDEEEYNIVDNHSGYSNEVIPETIGQYTGLTDKNGTKIFEGDIVMFGFSPCVVKYDLPNGRYMFYEKGVYLKNGFNIDTMKTKKVIGNIHDNPELLKEQA